MRGLSKQRGKDRGPSPSFFVSLFWEFSPPPLPMSGLNTVGVSAIACHTEMPVWRPRTVGEEGAHKKKEREELFL